VLAVLAGCLLACRYTPEVGDVIVGRVTEVRVPPRQLHCDDRLVKEQCGHTANASCAVGRSATAVPVYRLHQAPVTPQLFLGLPRN
jgi:hypothetical protein